MICDFVCEIKRLLIVKLLYAFPFYRIFVYVMTIFIILKDVPFCSNTTSLPDCRIKNSELVNLNK